MASADKHIAIYMRVSSKSQDHKSQLPDLERWAAAQDESIVWYRDKASGRNMDRPGWRKLETAIMAGKVSRIVCWRLDRLGRTVGGLVTLFEELQQRKVGLVSLREGLDLSTPAGRLMAHVLASVAAYESEIKGERIIAGQAVARANGTRWGGSNAGWRRKSTSDKAKTVRTMHGQGESISAIARAVGLSRPTIYSILGEQAT